MREALRGLLALVIPTVLVGGVLARYWWENYKARRCDACRIEAAQSGRPGTSRGAQSNVILAHACSRKRWPYKRPEVAR